MSKKISTPVGEIKLDHAFWMCGCGHVQRVGVSSYLQDNRCMFCRVSVEDGRGVPENLVHSTQFASQIQKTSLERLLLWRELQKKAAEGLRIQELKAARAHELKNQQRAARVKRETYMTPKEKADVQRDLEGLTREERVLYYGLKKPKLP